jgi:hypothetical protein
MQEYKYTIVDPHGANFVYKKIDHPDYKYELVEDYSIQLDFYPPEGKDIITAWFCWWEDGRILIKAGYGWDGVSGPMMDTINTMIPGCLHDFGYQGLRESLFPQSYKRLFDLMFQKLMITCSKSEGMIPKAWNWTRAKYAYLGVKFFGSKYCKPVKQH